MRLVASLVLVVVLAPARSRADELERVYAEGVELRRQHKDLEALERFRQAHALQPSGRTQAQIGFAEQALGRWAAAERDLQAALATPGDPWLEKNRGAIERALAVADEHLGTLQIDGSPPGAEVRVEGVRAGALPLDQPLRVPAGLATIEVVAEGHVPALRSVPIVARKMHRERIDLVRLSAAVAPTPPEHAPRPLDRRLWLGGWLVLGAGAAMLVVGAAGIGVRESAAVRYNSPACAGNGLTFGENCGGLRDTVQLGERLTISGFAIGGVLAVGGVVMLAVHAARRRESR